MRKGLTLTLMTAAIALIGLQAMAMAPVIKDIPSPIVGNENSATNPTTFVYADAINLDNYVTDDPPTTPADVIWSYVEDSNTYRINGVTPLDLATDDPTLATGKRINGTTKDPADVDGLSNTITVRNIALTPISGSATRTPGANGANNVIASETKAVTLFASDGTTYSQTELLFYTDNGGNDRLSPSPSVGTPVFSSDFSTLSGFAYSHIFGTVTTSTANSSALCLQTVAGGDNMGYWHSPYGAIPLVDNAVYHVRMHVNSTQTVANTVPLWDLVIINSDETGAKGKNLYGGDFIFFDNVGGANAALASGGRNDFDVWWCPAAIKQPGYRSTTTGAFSTTFAPDKDARFQFRVLDNVGNAGIHADQALGSICLDSVSIERFDLSAMQIETADLLNMTSITDAASGGNTHLEKIFSGTTATFANGTITVRPNAASEYASVAPGDTAVNMSDGTTLADNWPVPIVTDGIYEIVYGLSAPTDNDVTNSPDVFWVSADVPSMEVIQLSFMTNWLNSAAMPQATGAAQEYIAFYSANAVSKDPAAAFKFMRPRLDMGNNADLKVGNNSGAITVHSVKVNKVKFQ